MKIKVDGILVLACVAPLALSGCTSAVTGTEAERAFTAFDKIATNGTTKNKIVGTGLWTANNATTEPAASDLTAYVTVDDDEVTGVELEIGTVNRTWGKDDLGTSLLGGRIVTATANPSGTQTQGLLVGDPVVNAFNYQTFGAWYDNDTAEGSLGGFSVGRKIDADTELDAHPDKNQTQITFSGHAAGFLYDSSDTAAPYKAVTAEARLVVDFAGSTGAFTTTNTTVAGSANTLYNLTANTLDIADGGFSGDIVDNQALPANVMEGTISGSFYGPQAQEAGGSFWLVGQGTTLGDILSGGFGAKK